MSTTPHELAADFPGKVEKLHALKLEDSHFAKLVAAYDEVNDQVARAEARLDVITEEAEQALRRRRAQLKDEIARQLAIEV